MKVLIPFYPYADCFTDNVAVTLKAMGHEVATLGPPPQDPAAWTGLPSRVARAVAERIAGSNPTREERRVLNLAKAFKPDLLLALTRDIHPEILGAFRKICPGRRVLWWGDPPANSQRWGMLDPGWDAVYVQDRDAGGMGRNGVRLAQLRQCL